MDTDRNRKIKFYHEFGEVRCLRCGHRISENHRTWLLSCRHIFCNECFRKECKPSTEDRRVFSCGKCQKPYKVTVFSENLSTSVLESFKPIKSQRNSKRPTVFQSNTRQERFERLKRKHDKYLDAKKRMEHGIMDLLRRYERLQKTLDHYHNRVAQFLSERQMEKVLTYPFDELQRMDWTNIFSRFSQPRPRTISETSPMPLIRQLLMKSMASSSTPSSASTSIPSSKSNSTSQRSRF